VTPFTTIRADQRHVTSLLGCLQERGDAPPFGGRWMTGKRVGTSSAIPLPPRWNSRMGWGWGAAEHRGQCRSVFSPLQGSGRQCLLTVRCL